MNDKLPAELAELYEAERAAPGAPADARARLGERLGASLAPAAPIVAAKTGLMLKLVVALAVAGGIGAGGLALLRSRPAARVVPVAVPAPPPLPPPPVAPAPAVLADPAPPPAPAPARPAPAPRRHDQLAAEQALLDQALAALQGNDTGGALALLARHEARHPNGALVEEREVLAVRALARAGRRDDARARAARFRARFPRSIQLEVIDALLERMGP